MEMAQHTNVAEIVAVMELCVSVKRNNENTKGFQKGVPFLMRKGATMSNYNGQFQDSSANTLLPTPHSFANIEGATASQAYIKGQMIVFNNRLCEVTSPIASGDTLTVGTNIAYKNVGDIGKQLVATDGTGFYFDVADGKYGFYPSASKVPAEFIPFGGSSPVILTTYVVQRGLRASAIPLSYKGLYMCMCCSYNAGVSSSSITTDGCNLIYSTAFGNGAAVAFAYGELGGCFRVSFGGSATCIISAYYLPGYQSVDTSTVFLTNLGEGETRTLSYTDYSNPCIFAISTGNNGNSCSYSQNFIGDDVCLDLGTNRERLSLCALPDSTSGACTLKGGSGYQSGACGYINLVK